MFAADADEGVNGRLYYNITDGDDHFSIDEKGAQAGTRLELDDSWGVAAHAGVEYAIDARWSLTVDARWIKLSTDAKLDGARIGSVDIDPLVYGFAIGYRF